MWLLVIVLCTQNLLNSFSILSPFDNFFLMVTTSTVPIGVPENYGDELHFVTTGNHYQQMHGDCGGCKVLWGLHDILKASNFSVDGVRYQRVPCNALLQQGRQMNRTQVIVWSEVAAEHCPGNPKEIINVWWILAPVEVHSSLATAQNWPPQDLVFNYATSTGTNVPISSILQILVNPQDGDETDIPDSAFYNKDRSGVAWLMRKGPKYHRKSRTYMNKLA